MIGSGTVDLTVGSTAGFPDSGTILVGNEKMTYTEKTDTTFKIALNGREADNTTAFTGATGDITGDITATVTSITIDTVQNGPFPETGTLLIGSEQITYTGFTTSGSEVTFTGCTRGANGTTAAAHTDATVDPGGLVLGDVTLLPEVSLVESVETLEWKLEQH